MTSQKKKDKKIKKYIYKRKEKKNNKEVVEGTKSHQNLQRWKMELSQSYDVYLPVIHVDR